MQSISSHWKTALSKIDTLKIPTTKTAVVQANMTNPDNYSSVPSLTEFSYGDQKIDVSSSSSSGSGSAEEGMKPCALSELLVEIIKVQYAESYLSCIP